MTAVDALFFLEILSFEFRVSKFEFPGSPSPGYFTVNITREVTFA